MDESNAAIDFDKDGRCSECRNAQSLRPSWLSSDALRSPSFDASIRRIKARRGHGQFDTLVGLSGGLDSSYVVVEAVKAGLSVLAMHCDTGWNSQESVSNIESLCKRLSIPLETVVIDWEAIRDAQRAFFLAGVPNCDIPQDHAIASTVGRLASKYRIHTFLSGGNWAAESILPNAWGHGANDLVHLRAVWKRFGNIALARRFPTYSWLRYRIVQPYIQGVQAWRILDDIRFDPATAKRTLIEEFGWREYGGKHCESVFTSTFQSVYLPMRFGIDKRRAHLSSLIVSGLLSRSDAMKRLAEPPMSQETAERNVAYLCEKLGFTPADWQKFITSPPVLHTAYPVDKFDRAIATWVKKRLERGGRWRRSW